MAAAVVRKEMSSSSCGVRSEKKKLDSLQTAMKGDAEGYVSELNLIYRQFKSLVEIFEQNQYLGVGVGFAKDLGDQGMFLAHLAPFYPIQLVDYPKHLIQFLNASASYLPSKLRFTLTKALILMVNKKIVAIKDTLVLFMELQLLNDKALKRLAFSHVIRSIGRMNKKHYNETENRRLQSLIFSMLQEKPDVAVGDLKAMRSLVTLCHLYRTKVWFDDRTSNAICRACYHSSSRIVVAALKFLLGYEKIEQDDDDDDDDGDDSSDQGETTSRSYASVSKEAIYKANSMGTTSSKKKKKAKLQRVIRSLKRQQQRSSSAPETNSNYSSPLVSLQDPQGFAEELFSQLKKKSVCPFKIRKMIVEVVARTIGLHRLILLDFYPYIETYVDRNQREVSSILAAAIQACHDMVPPDAVESLLKKVVDKLIHGCTRTESITVGLNVVREICVRVPLAMTEDMLQDLVLYKKSHSKAVSSAARSLISLFREICPSLLLKKDRGRPTTNSKATPKAFGEVTIHCDVPGADLLVDDDDDDDVPGANLQMDDDDSEEDDDEDDYLISDPEEMDADSDSIKTGDGGLEVTSDVDGHVENEDVKSSSSSSSSLYRMPIDIRGCNKIIRGRKRKILDTDEQLDSAGEGQSLRALKKRLLVVGGANSENNDDDGILSNEDFQRINELKAMKEARLALASHGLLKNSSNPTVKIPSSDQLRMKRVDGYALQANIRKKMTKEQRKALIKAGRQEIGNKYQAKAAIKRQKTGGLSNRQKEHKKAMPLAAKRSTIKHHKIMKQRRGAANKQFRGRKAWK